MPRIKVAAKTFRNAKRQNLILFDQFNLIWAVQSSPAKTFRSPFDPNHRLGHKGRFAIVRTLGAGYDGRNGVRGRTALIAEGEAVWS
jgi:hypothetical protein